MDGQHKKKQQPYLVINPGLVTQKTAELAAPIASSCAVEIAEVEYLKEGSQWFLRVFIDKEGGVDIDDCAAVSRKLSAVLDDELQLPQPYTLEVSSPGVERPLRRQSDFEKYKGEMVTVCTREPYEGYTQFTGILEGLVDEKIVLIFNGQLMTIPYELMVKAHLAFYYQQ